MTISALAVDMTLPSERIAIDLLTTIDGACNTSPGMVDCVVSAQFGQGCYGYPANLTLWHTCRLSGRDLLFSFLFSLSSDLQSVSIGSYRLIRI